mgnify:CR=1 FL=1
MGGINDLKNAFQAAAPHVQVSAVRMRYDNANKKQVIEADIVDAQGARTITESIDMGLATPLMCEALAKAAAAIGATVPEEPAPAEKPQSLMGDIGGGDAPILGKPLDAGQTLKVIDAPAGSDLKPGDVINHKGEKYELAHDGSPSTLFF